MSENAKLHGCMREVLRATWHMHRGGPTPHAFPMHVLRFHVFRKIFSSFVIMKHSPT